MNIKTSFGQMKELTEESLKNVIKDSHIEELAKRAGLGDLPERPSTGLDTNEEGFVSFYKGKIHKMSEIVERRLNLIQTEVREIRDSLLNGTKDALVRIEEKDLEPELKKIEVYYAPKLASASSKTEEASRIYRYFRVENSVLDRLPKKPAGTLWIFAQFLAFVVFEGITLASFYADLTDGGLVGGAGLAASISILNVFLGFMVGSFIRAFNSKRITQKLFSTIGVLVFGSFLMFSIALAGQFRFAAKEQVEIFAAEGPNQGLYTGKSTDKTLITPYQGDEDARPQWIARRAFENTLLNGFVVRDAMSGWVTLLTFVFGVLAVTKSYSRLDPTPGYWEKFDDLQKCQEAEEKLKTERLTKINEVFDSRLSRISSISEVAETSRSKIEDLFNKLEEEERNMIRFLNDTEASCLNSLQKYRDLKRLVATNKATLENDPKTSFDGFREGFDGFSKQVRGLVSGISGAEVKAQVTETHRLTEAAIQRLTDRKDKALSSLIDTVIADPDQSLEDSALSFAG